MSAQASPSRARQMATYFGNQPGSRLAWRGLSVPQVRALGKRHRDLAEPQLLQLLRSKWHEDRLLALIVLAERSRRAGPVQQDRLARWYLRHRSHVTEWDLVDTSAPQLLGPFISRHGAARLLSLARSRRIWDRRIAIVGTQHLIRAGTLAPTFQVAELLLDDAEDLIHKATGWMLREAGQKDPARLREFLERHATRMPRTMLRSAIERLPKAEQARWRAR